MQQYKANCKLFFRWRFYKISKNNDISPILSGILIEFITADTLPSPPQLSVNAGAALGQGAIKITQSASLISSGKGIKK